MAEKKILNKRKWLNPLSSCDSGAVEYYVEVCDYGYVEAGITVWDCSRKTTLDFGFGSEKYAKQRAQKIQILIDSLEEMKRGLAKAYELEAEGYSNKDDDE